MMGTATEKRVLVLGAKAAGKTALAQRLVAPVFDQRYSQTFGAELYTFPPQNQ